MLPTQCPVNGNGANPVLKISFTIAARLVFCIKDATVTQVALRYVTKELHFVSNFARLRMNKRTLHR